MDLQLMYLLVNGLTDRSVATYSSDSDDGKSAGVRSPVSVMGLSVALGLGLSNSCSRLGRLRAMFRRGRRDTYGDRTKLMRENWEIDQSVQNAREHMAKHKTTKIGNWVL